MRQARSTSREQNLATPWFSYIIKFGGLDITIGHLSISYNGCVNNIFHLLYTYYSFLTNGMICPCDVFIEIYYCDFFLSPNYCPHLSYLFFLLPNSFSPDFISYIYNILNIYNSNSAYERKCNRLPSVCYPFSFYPLHLVPAFLIVSLLL